MLVEKLNADHVNIFRALMFDELFKRKVTDLLLGDTKCRLKCHEILESLATFFMNYCASRSVYEITEDEADPLQLSN